MTLQIARAQVLKKIEIRRVHNFVEAAELRDAWNQIVFEQDQSAVPSVFQTYEWNSCWWQEFGSPHELLLLAAFDQGGLVGVAPWMVVQERSPFPRKVVRFIGSLNFASDYSALIMSPGREDVLHAMASWLEARPEIWDELDLFNMMENSPEWAVFQARWGRGWIQPDLSYRCDAPTRFLGDPTQDQDLVSRKSLKRHFNGFNKQGCLTVQHLIDPKEILPLLDQFFEQHIERRSMTEHPSQFLEPVQRHFYRSITQELGSRGWVRFCKIEFNGAPIAFHFGFEMGKKFYWYKPSFAVQYTQKSPGEVLLKVLFEDAIERKLSEFDFTAGNEAFKYRFSNHIRKLYRLRIFRTLPAYTAFRARREAGAWMRWLRRKSVPYQWFTNP